MFTVENKIKILSIRKIKIKIKIEEIKLLEERREDSKQRYRNDQIKKLTNLSTKRLIS